jgi:hypothetical protein
VTLSRDVTLTRHLHFCSCLRFNLGRANQPRCSFELGLAILWRGLWNLEQVGRWNGRNTLNCRSGEVDLRSRHSALWEVGALRNQKTKVRAGASKMPAVGEVPVL